MTRYFTADELTGEEIYLHYGISGILRATKLHFDKGFWWTTEPLSIKATTLPMVKFSDIADHRVRYGDTLNGKIKIVLPTNDFEHSRYCHCSWEQTYDEKGRLILPCGWVKLSDLKFI